MKNVALIVVAWLASSVFLALFLGRVFGLGRRAPKPPEERKEPLRVYCRDCEYKKPFRFFPLSGGPVCYREKRLKNPHSGEPIADLEATKSGRNRDGNCSLFKAGFFKRRRKGAGPKIINKKNGGVEMNIERLRELKAGLRLRYNRTWARDLSDLLSLLSAEEARLTAPAVTEEERAAAFHWIRSVRERLAGIGWISDADIKAISFFTALLSAPPAIEERDRLWCLALLGTLDSDQIAKVTGRFCELRGSGKSSSELVPASPAKVEKPRVTRAAPATGKE